MSDPDRPHRATRLRNAADEALRHKGLGAVARIRPDGSVSVERVPGSTMDLASIASVLELAGVRIEERGNTLEVIRAEIRIDSLLLTSLDNAVRLEHLDAKRIRHLLKHPEEICDVLVYEDPGSAERVLVNGRHRVQAARMLGRKTIDADVRTGTRHDSTRYRDLVHTEWGLLHPECGC